MKHFMNTCAVVTTVAFVMTILTPVGMVWADDGDKEEKLPPDPGATPIPKDQSWAYGTVGEEDLAGEEPYEEDVVCVKVGLGAPKLQVEGLVILPGGVLLSEPKALRCADYKIAYKELRGLYEIDLELWAAKEKVYTQNLERADKEIVKLDKKLNGSWNRYKFAIGLAIGFGLATILSICSVIVVVKLM